MARYDDFNRVDGALGTPSDGGSAWTATANWLVASNLARISGGNAQIATLDHGTPYGRVRFKFVIRSSDGGLVVGNETDHFLYAARTGNSQWYRRVASSYTSVSPPVVAAHSPGDELYLEYNRRREMRAGNLTTGVQFPGVFHDPLYTLSNTFGMRLHSDSAARYDDFAIDDLAAEDVTLPTREEFIHYQTLGASRAHTFTNCQSGDIIAAAVLHTPSAARSYSAADPSGKSYTSHTSPANDGRQSTLFWRYVDGTDSSSITTTVTQSGTFLTIRIYFIRLRPATGYTFSQVGTDSTSQASSLGSHYCGATGITVPYRGVGLALLTTPVGIQGAHSLVWPVSLAGGVNNTAHCMSLIGDTAYLNERAEVVFISGGISTGVMSVWESVAAGGPSTAIPTGILTAVGL
jgi:hypothetical protein